MLVSFAVLGLVALVVAGRAGPGLVEPPPDGVALTLPEGRAMTGDDVRRVGFAMALRGYRMAEVDAVLARLASEIGERDDLIARLAEAPAGSGPTGDAFEWAEPGATGPGAAGDGPTAGAGEQEVRS